MPPAADEKLEWLLRSGDVSKVLAEAGENSKDPLKAAFSRFVALTLSGVAAMKKDASASSLAELKALVAR